MEARAIGDIVQETSEQRAGILAFGLELLVEHIGELQRAGGALRESSKGRGAAILDVVRGEEAAKALILVDAVRLGWTDGKAVSRHLRGFSNHVTRGIYCEVMAMSPATFGEVRRHVDRLRRSQYLDGPHDVDWTFRNEIERRREEAFYVDYVKYDDGHQWISPKDRSQDKAWGPDDATDLVLAMERLGMLTERGLQLISEAWAGVQLSDEHDWQDHLGSVKIALEAISKAGLFTGRATQKDVDVVRKKWSFPLGTLDLSRRTIPNSALEEERERAMDRLYADLYGAPDH